MPRTTFAPGHARRFRTLVSNRVLRYKALRVKSVADLPASGASRRIRLVFRSAAIEDAPRVDLDPLVAAARTNRDPHRVRRGRKVLRPAGQHSQ
jgi:hypothetical protein